MVKYLRVCKRCLTNLRKQPHPVIVLCDPLGDVPLAEHAVLAVLRPGAALDGVGGRPGVVVHGKQPGVGERDKVLVVALKTEENDGLKVTHKKPRCNKCVKRQASVIETRCSWLP